MKAPSTIKARYCHCIDLPPHDSSQGGGIHTVYDERDLSHWSKSHLISPARLVYNQNSVHDNLQFCTVTSNKKEEKHLQPVKGSCITDSPCWE